MINITNKLINKVKVYSDLKNEIEYEKKYNEMYNSVITKQSNDIKKMLLDKNEDNYIINKNKHLKLYNEKIIYEYICPDYTIIIDNC